MISIKTGSPALLAGLLLSGCTLPAHTIGLNTVLTKELGGFRNNLPDYRCTMGAHRGASMAYIENTLDAIRAAGESPRYDFIEFDVQYAADNRVLVFHDERLFRVFGRMAKVADSTYDELRELTGGEIAAYDEVMELVGNRRVNIEIKSRGDADEDCRLVDFIVADVKERKITDRVLISAISEEVIRYLKDRHPKMAAGQIFWLKASTYLPFDSLTEGLYRDVQASRADYLFLHVSNLHNIRDLLRLKPKGKTLVFWDFDDAIYVVHKDLSDRMWGDSGLKTFFDLIRYKTAGDARTADL
ncbi:MAG: hypothetical protein JEZ10_01750 [Verrucomicrobia bacterium]|nr:hypothetical protein [Verrucomicrobiota bacterium]